MIVAFNECFIIFIVCKLSYKQIYTNFTLRNVGNVGFNGINDKENEKKKKCSKLHKY